MSATVTKPKKIAGGAMIHYRDNDQYSLVYLDGKRVGTILMFSGKGFAYAPKNGSRGEYFPSRDACKASIEGSTS